jgi:hypothetical protein
MPSRWSMAEFSIGTEFNTKIRRIFYYIIELTNWDLRNMKNPDVQILHL